MASYSRKSDQLPVERTQFGFVQRARFSHPDLHHEEVLELDSPFAAAVAAGTHVFSFVLLGDQNAGKSTFLHSFSYADEPHWLQLSSYLPLLSSAFLNVRLLPPGDNTPPRDELPYLDTDIGRSNFLMTAENFAFFLREFGLDRDVHGTGTAPSLHKCLGDARYVLTQFIEVGGDHLDRLIAHASPPDDTASGSSSLPGWLDDTLKMSERLLKGVGRGAYYINASTLVQSDASPLSTSEIGDNPAAQLVINVPALRLLFNRLSYLSCSAPSGGMELLILVSRLPPSDGATATVFDPCQSVTQINAALGQLGLQDVLGQGLVASDFVFQPATDLNNLPDPEEDVELDLRVDDHPLVHFIRQLLKVVHHALDWKLHITQVLPATHHLLLSGTDSGGADKMTSETHGAFSAAVDPLVLSVSGLVGTLVRLFDGRLMDSSSQHPDGLVASHILGCWEDVGRRVCQSNGNRAGVALFNPYVTVSDFRDYLLDDTVADQLELPATTILQRFEPVSRHLVSAGLCLQHAGQNQARLAVRFWHEQQNQHSEADDHSAIMSRDLVGDWRTCRDLKDKEAAEFGIRFPYHSRLMAAIRGHFDREVPTEFWLHCSRDAEEHPRSSAAPSMATAFAGVKGELEEARSSLQAESRRLLKELISTNQSPMNESKQIKQPESNCEVLPIRASTDQLTFHLEELALVTQILHGNSSSACLRVSVRAGGVASLLATEWLSSLYCIAKAGAEQEHQTEDILCVDVVLTEE